MISDQEIKIKGMRVLSEQLGDVEAERFVALILRDQFDYTQWRQSHRDDASVEAISREAMALRAREERDPTM